MTSAAPTTAGRQRFALGGGIAAALIFGVALRFVFLSRQLLIGDELHPVTGAVERTPAEILSSWTYYGADYCVPLTFLFRLISDAGVPLTELTLRLPVLAAGLAAVAIIPWMMRERIGTRAAVLLAFLVALSPLLALYSRIVRSYMPAVLLAFVAVLCFEAWLRTRRRRAAASYAVCASLAIWSNLTTLPFVAAPLLYAGLRTTLVALRGGREPNATETGRIAWPIRWGSLFGVGAFAALCVAAPLLPALESLLALREIHGRGAPPSVGTWLEVVQMHAGTRSRWLAVLATVALARGALLLSRSDRELLLYFAAIASLHVVGLLILGPSQLDNPIVINRYLLVLLPLGLALVALGLADPWPRVPAAGQATAVVAFLAALFATGPFVDPAFRTSSFVHAPTFTYFVREGNWLAPDAAPAFYRELGASSRGDDARTRPIIEYPWFNIASHAFDAYQKIHGRPLLVGTPSVTLQDPRLRLEHILKPSVLNYLTTDARWLVVHLDLQAEERRVHTSNRNHWMRLELRPGIWQPLLRAGRESARNIEQRWGPPDRAEDGLRVWDLDRLRAQQRADGASRNG